jgi:putative membrane protein
MSDSGFPFGKLLKGAMAGFFATAPMTASMLIGWGLLPRHEQYPLPPRLITQEISERVGIQEHLSEPGLKGLTILSHFAYGTVFGAVYALFESKVPMHSSLKAALAGLALWMGSYLGWLPSMGLLVPATRHPWRRNLLMIIAHLIWGLTLGEVIRKLTAGNSN